MIKSARIYNGEKTVFNKWGNAKIEQLHTKESNELLYQTMHKNKFANETIKLLEKNGSTIFAIGLTIFFICLLAQVKQKQK